MKHAFYVKFKKRPSLLLPIIFGSTRKISQKYDVIYGRLRREIFQMLNAYWEEGPIQRDLNHIHISLTNQNWNKNPFPTAYISLQSGIPNFLYLWSSQIIHLHFLIEQLPIRATRNI